MNKAFSAAVRCGMTLAACVVLAACNSDSGGHGPWQEEVQISDGRMILVERLERNTVRKPIGDAGGAFLDETTLEVVAPAELATTLPVLTTRYRPLILDFDPKIGTWFARITPDRVLAGPHRHTSLACRQAFTSLRKWVWPPSGLAGVLVAL